MLNTVKKTLFQGVGHGDQCREHYNGILQWGKDIRLNFKYCMGECKCIANEQDGVNGWKITTRKHQEKGEFSLNQPNSCWRQARLMRYHLGEGVIRNPFRYVGLSYIEDGRFSLSRFNRVPTKIGQYREIQNWANYGNPKFKSSCNRTQRRLSRVW